MNDLVLTPSQFVALLNQTLEIAYPMVTIEGELSEYKINKNQWVYFKLKDDEAVIDFFGSIHQLAGPVEDGMVVRVVARPRLSPRYGFSLSFESITPVGEGSIRRALEILKLKLETEGLFAPERKRQLPELPRRVGLISSQQAAGYGDFLKVLEERWGDTTVTVANVAVQGEHAVTQIIDALNYFNQQTKNVEVLVVVRGGGSAEDLGVFNDETLTRAIASSRIPVLTAIGHERDLHLADLAADQHVATPTKAAILLFPDRHLWLSQIEHDRDRLNGYIKQLVIDIRQRYAADLKTAITAMFEQTQQSIEGFRNTLTAYNPEAVLKRGYSILSSGGALVNSIKQATTGQQLRAQVSDGIIESEVTGVRPKT